MLTQLKADLLQLVDTEDAKGVRPDVLIKSLYLTALYFAVDGHVCCVREAYPGYELRHLHFVPLGYGRNNHFSKCQEMVVAALEQDYVVKFLLDATLKFELRDGGGVCRGLLVPLAT